MERYNKPTRKRLRALAGIAHERELARELGKLHEQFAGWQAQKIDAFELNERIHQYHQKTAREIWKRYSHNGHEDMMVSQAVRSGLLTEEEVGEDLLEQLGPMIRYWQDGGPDATR